MMKNAVPIHFMELERRYEKLLWWCDVLQAIADFLPCHIDEGLCGRISSDLMPLLLTTYELEDRLHCSAALKRAMEHQESEERRQAQRSSSLNATEDLVAILTALGEGSCRLSWEAVAYQMRSFLCPMRRQIKSEREIMGSIQQAPIEQTAA